MSVADKVAIITATIREDNSTWQYGFRLPNDEDKAQEILNQLSACPSGVHMVHLAEKELKLPACNFKDEQNDVHPAKAGFASDGTLTHVESKKNGFSVPLGNDKDTNYMFYKNGDLMRAEIVGDVYSAMTEPKSSEEALAYMKDNTLNGLKPLPCTGIGIAWAA
jgi:hypothetical protein